MVRPGSPLRGAGFACLLLILVACDRPGAAPEAQPAPTAPAVVPSTDDLAEERSSGTLRYAVEPHQTIVPVDASEPGALTVVDALFDSLTTWGPDLEVAPRAAVTWWSDPEAMTWTFRLREDAVFHDGTPVHADDFKAAWELTVELDEAGHHLADVAGYQAFREGARDELTGVVAVDDHILEVHLSRPNADFPAVAAHPALGPVARDRWDADPAAYRTRPVGNGPFAIVEDWAPAGSDEGGDGSRFIRAKAFGDWRNDIPATRVGAPAVPPDVEEVLFVAMDADTAYLAFQQGRVDVSPVPLGALADARERYGESADGYAGPGVLTGDQAAVYFLAFNTEHPPFDEPEVRRAVSLAFNRAALVEEHFQEHGVVSRSMIPPVIPGGQRVPCRSCSYQPQRAAEIFGAHGVRSVTFWYNREGSHEAVANRLRDDLAEVGVRVSLRAVDFDDYLSAIEGRQAGLFRFGWSLDYPTMDDALYPLFHSSATPESGGFNYLGYGDEDVDRLLDEARRTVSRPARDILHRRAEHLVLNRDQAIAPLMTFRHAVVVSDRVTGFVLDALGTSDLATVELVDGDAQEPRSP